MIAVFQENSGVGGGSTNTATLPPVQNYPVSSEDLVHIPNSPQLGQQNALTINEYEPLGISYYSPYYPEPLENLANNRWGACLERRHHRYQRCGRRL